MLEKENYKNGQKIYELNGNILTFFYKSGKVKAKGIFVNGTMEGEWFFYRETGRLCQIGNFLNGTKNGVWARYNKNNQLEYHEVFENNKIVKKRS